MSRRTPSPRLLFSAAAIALLAPLGARAEQIDQTLDGKRLSVDVTCVDTVEIQPQAELAGKVTVEASSTVDGELKDFVFTGGDAASVTRPHHHCTRVGDEGPKVTVAIRVPAAMPIEIKAAGSTNFIIGPVGGPLAAHLAGSGSIEAESVTDLQLSVSGSGDTAFAQVTGTGDVQIAGSGSMKIASAAMASLKLELSGSGNVGIDQGKIAKLAAAIAGSGDLRIRADVQDADLSAVGSGNIDIAKISGALASRKTSSGSIRIGRAGPG
jgi:hypothetical protein